MNKLIPGADLLTGNVRDRDGKGRHTTTSSSLLDFPGGGTVIDTPGIRSLGLVDLEPHDLARTFPGFFRTDGSASTTTACIFPSLAAPCAPAFRGRVFQRRASITISRILQAAD